MYFADKFYKPFSVTPKAKRTYAAVISHKAYGTTNGIVTMPKDAAITATIVTTAITRVIRKITFVGALSLISSPCVEINYEAILLYLP
jgi:hypothetical protein